MFRGRIFVRRDINNIGRDLHKKKNEVVSRNLLATRHQLLSEFIDGFYQALIKLSKDCSFSSLSRKDRFYHDKNLELFMAAVKRYNLTLNQDECYFRRKRMKLLGYIISKGNIKPVPEHLCLLLSFPMTNVLSTLRRALGMFVHHSHKILSFSDKIHPLTTLMKFLLSPEASKAAITTPDHSLPLVSETDVSEYTIVVSLKQLEWWWGVS